MVNWHGRTDGFWSEWLVPSLWSSSEELPSGMNSDPRVRMRETEMAGGQRAYLQWSSLSDYPEVPSERRQVESQSLTFIVRMGSFPWTKHNFIPQLRVWRDKAEAIKLPPVLPLLNFKPWKGLLRQIREDLELQNIDCYNTKRKEKHWNSCPSKL